ncbi:hypothetical protein DFJ74DRAFT_679524 [Hyaloraphidium curvatum]|nr:hypothetical protein DFJ74DRAFT_679524 [Hyaloraphidium curvatum]
MAALSVLGLLLYRRNPAGAASKASTPALERTNMSLVDVVALPDLEAPLKDPFYNAGFLRNLIIVAGHAVLRLGLKEALKGRPSTISGESAWALQSYQNQTDVNAIVQHIRLGVEIASKDPKSLLVFSGGRTNSAFDRSEGVSYWLAARALGCFRNRTGLGVANIAGVLAGSNGSILLPVEYRSIAEEYSRDSYENLLFSICRFRAFTGRYPTNVTVISFRYKKLRFADFHRAAIRFPADRVSFFSEPRAFSSSGKHRRSIASALYRSQTESLARVRNDSSIPEHEISHSLMSSLQDPHGCFPPLSTKRKQRDPFQQGPVPTDECPEIRDLITVCNPATMAKVARLKGKGGGIKRLYIGPVPWDGAAGDVGVESADEDI